MSACNYIGLETNIKSFISNRDPTNISFILQFVFYPLTIIIYKRKIFIFEI